MEKFKEYLGLGIAGNFALHLAQAGELEEFQNIITEDEAAPKGIFPFYLPCQSNATDADRPRPILATYPLSATTIELPKEPCNVQAEPEVALICSLSYAEDGSIQTITPQSFAAYNDCSIRVAGAQKISDKKNWGANSKGLAEKLIAIDSFTAGGVMDHYRICSFLRRNDELHAYGEDVALTGYSYFYEKLQEWIVNQINTQEDFGPLEDIKSYIAACNNPKNLIISIGATRYTPYGETTFLQSGDEVIVALYDKRSHTQEDLLNALDLKEYDASGLCILAQKVL